MKEELVIGIDPGSRRTGWGLVREKSGALELIDCGIIRTEGGRGGLKAVNDSSEFARRLALIFRSLASVLAKYKPCTAAVEQIFTARNAATALKLGQARGAAIAACAAHNLEIFDYEPTLVKRSLVGTGRAEKEQVAFMVGRLLNVKEKDWALDTTDALAVAICHLSQRRFQRLASIGG